MNSYENTYILNSKVWYYRIVQKDSEHTTIPRINCVNKNKVLFDDYPRYSLINSNKLIVSTRINKDNKEIILYTVFDTYEEFILYQDQFEINERHFYEVILGENNQKPHFDLDIKLTDESEDNLGIYHDSIFNQVIDGIIHQFEVIKVKLDLEKDILVYTSHGRLKKSYHILVNNYYHESNKDSKNFYKRVLLSVEEKYKKYIDHSVYSSLQQFRMLNSQSISSKRIKIFNHQWYHRSNFYSHKSNDFEDFKNSLITNTNNCILLPDVVSNVPSLINLNNVITEDDNSILVDREVGKKAVEMYKRHLITKKSERFPYVMDEIKDELIILKRIMPSLCPICNRIHESENSFLLVVGIEYTVYFYCRRSSANEKILIGKLKPNPINDIISTWTKGLVDKFKVLDQNILNNYNAGYDTNYQSKLSEAQSISEEPKIISSSKILSVQQVLYDNSKRIEQFNTIEEPNISKIRKIDDNNKRSSNIERTKDLEDKGIAVPPSQYTKKNNILLQNCK